MKNISILGLGLIGGSLAKALKNSNQNLFVSGWDKSQIAEQAVNQKIIDKKITDVDESLDSDIIFLSLPTDLSLKYFTELSPKLKNNQIITDVSGVKGVFETEWQKIKSSGYYIGGHPMTGKEKGGLVNSDSLLFENSLYLLSDKSEHLPCINKFTALIKLTGARIKFINPFLHDKIIAKVSHLPQVLAVSLINSIKENNYLDFAAGGFRDLTRIASSDFNVWEPLLLYNKKEVLSALENFINELNTIKNIIDKDDAESLKQLFESSKNKRENIPSNIKGFLNPVYDIYIFAEDKPGTLFKLTEVLFKNSINIKDIELLKIREGTGGTFRLSFETKKIADRASQLLIDSGYHLA